MSNKKPSDKLETSSIGLPIDINKIKKKHEKLKRKKFLGNLKTKCRCANIKSVKD